MKGALKIFSRQIEKGNFRTWFSMRAVETETRARVFEKKDKPGNKKGMK